MKGNTWRRCLLTLSLVFLGVPAPDNFAAEKPPFYQGKTLNFVINFGAGGPTDIESRIFARHLSKHIPGNPNVTVQNMGGVTAEDRPVLEKLRERFVEFDKQFPGDDRGIAEEPIEPHAHVQRDDIALTKDARFRRNPMHNLFIERDA